MILGSSKALVIGIISIVIQGILKVAFPEYPVEICVGTTGTVLVAYITKRLIGDIQRVKKGNK
jgi:hypothetical protein